MAAEMSVVPDAARLTPVRDPALREEIADFVLREAELLDDRRFDEWLALFAPDGVYWMPSEPDQADPLNTASIFYEDREILAIRIRRMTHPANVAQSPAPRTSHLLANTRACAAADGSFDVVSRMHVVEYREGDGQRVFAGICRHTLRRVAGQLKIVMKRVDLVDCDAPHHFISVPL